jgi:uncharacterized protein with FMN-binding domain
MPKKAIVSLLLTVVGLWTIVTYSPPKIDEIGVGVGPSPLPSDSGAPKPSGKPKPSASTDATPTPAGSPGSTSQPTPKPTAKPKPSAAMKDGTYTGANTNYNYGMMEVTIKVSGGKIVDASVSQNGRWPIGFRNKSCTESDFNTRAISIDSGKAFFSLQFCSGATYSKWGYATSLQSAIDQAKQ